MKQRDPDRTIIDHDNEFTMVNTRLFKLGTDPYVLPSQCEQVFYSDVPGRGGWSFAMRHDPRGKSVKYNMEDDNEEGLEEEDDVEDDQHELEHHVPEEDDKKLVESDDLAYNVHEDDIDDDMMK